MRTFACSQQTFAPSGRDANANKCPIGHCSFAPCAPFAALPSFMGFLHLDQPDQLNAIDLARRDQPFGVGVFGGAVERHAAGGGLLSWRAFGEVLLGKLGADQLDIDRADDRSVCERRRVGTGVGQHGHEDAAQQLQRL